MSSEPAGSRSLGLRVRGLTVKGPATKARAMKGPADRDQPRPVVADLNLDLAPGHRLAITGPSSADVTAVLACLAGLSAPAAGSVLVEASSADEIAIRRRRPPGEEP